MSERSRNGYRVTATFAAPLEFVFRWCTDFSVRDPAITGERYRRRILERSNQRVVFEDLASTPGGWVWLRNDVSLTPPDRWHLEAVGTHAGGSADYKLRSIGSARTRLEMTGVLTPGVRDPPLPTRSQVEGSLRGMWTTYGREIAREFRRAH